MGAVSVLKTNIKGSRIPYFMREKRVHLQQPFPKYNKMYARETNLEKEEPKQPRTGDTLSYPNLTIVIH